MVIPKINFVWSSIYQEEIHLPKDVKYNGEKTSKDINKFIRKLSKEWKRVGNPLLKYMKKLTGLKWNRREINCYVVYLSKYRPFSDPLTVPIKIKSGNKIHNLTFNRFVDILIHELIHNLFIQNDNKKLYNYFDYIINNKYKEFKWNVAIHVPVHAIHKEIFLKFFNKKRLEKEIYSCSNYPEYKQAWDIVMEEGSKKIIKGLRSNLTK